MTEKRWIHLANGRSVFRRVEQAAVQRSSFPCPRIISDSIDTVQSMADGNYYDSLSALRRTYRADGNPQGEDYIELGNEALPDHKPEFNEAQRREDVARTLYDIQQGNVSDEIKAIQ